MAGIIVHAKKYCVSRVIFLKRLRVRFLKLSIEGILLIRFKSSALVQFILRIKGTELFTSNLAAVD